MAIDLKKPSELPPAASVGASDAIPIDNNVSVAKATPEQIVNAGRPVASESQAIDGTDNETAMTPLTTRQAIEADGAKIVERAQAWAESHTAPGDPGTKSAKTWAGEAAGSATAATTSADEAQTAAEGAAVAAQTEAWILRRISRLEDEEAAQRYIKTYWPGWKDRVIGNDAGTDGGFNPYGNWGPVAVQNIKNAIANLNKNAYFRWTPVDEIAKSRARAPDMYPAGVERSGAPYATVLQQGRLIGTDVAPLTFLSAILNPNSVLYGPEIFFGDSASPAGGRLFYGNVCSSFIGYGLQLAYPPSTGLLSAHPEHFGFDVIDPIDFSDVRTGDLVIRAFDHVELVSFRGPNVVELFDQTFEGPRKAQKNISAFQAYCAANNYYMLRYRYDEVSITYEEDPYAPLVAGGAQSTDIEDRLIPNMGTRFNYMVGDTVELTIQNAPDVVSLIIEKDGVEGSPISVSNNTVHDVIYDDPGDIGTYRAWLVMDDNSESDVCEWKICKVDVTVGDATTGAAAEVVTGENVTISFVVENCTPLAIVLSGTEVPHRFLTGEEIAAGEVVMSFDEVGSHRIFIRCVNEFGSAYNVPYYGLKHRVEISAA